MREDTTKRARPRWKNSKYHLFADGEIHSMDVEAIRRFHGGTREQFKACLQTYASNHGLRCSTRRTSDGGLQFRIWNDRSQDMRLIPNHSHRECAHADTRNDNAWCRAMRALAD